MTKPLEVRNLFKTYLSKDGSKKVEAVNGVSFSLEKGEIFGLLGPNGAGKTSIISVITTLEKATSGEVFVAGDSIQEKPLVTKRKIGVVPQELIPQGFFNLVEILKFQSGYHGLIHNQERIDFLLHKLGLWEHRQKQVKQLSGGMKRRMMIAKALVHQPSILLLDEPTAGVDIELRKSLWEFVLELKKEGMSILLTTHYLQEAEELCDRIGIISKGQLCYLGKTQEIIKELTRRYVEVEFLDQQKKKFEIPAHQGVGEFLCQQKIQIESIKDLKTFEGNLEEAMMNVLRANQNGGAR